MVASSKGSEIKVLHSRLQQASSNLEKLLKEITANGMPNQGPEKSWYASPRTSV